MLPTRRIVPALALCAVLAPTAHAQINLAWNNCITQASAAENLNYACDGSRTGFPFKLVASFKAPTNLAEFVGIQMVIDVQNGLTHPGPDPLPDWWRLKDGECREGNLAFPTSMIGIGTGGAPSALCFNPFAGANTGGGYDYTSDYIGPGIGRLITGFARDTPTTLTSGQHYLSGVITLDTAFDVPNEADPKQCLGCCYPMYIILERVELYQIAGQPPPQQDIYVLNTQDVRNWVTWQASGTCQQTPAKRTTWGRIKTTYR